MKWYSGDNEEYYTCGPFDTKEEAVAAGIEEFSGFSDQLHVIEADYVVLSSTIFDGNEIIEELVNANSDCSNDEGELDVAEATDEHIADLENRLAATLGNWMIEHGYEKGWRFGETRNYEVFSLVTMQ